jgi:hypothetical protein
MDMGSAQHMLGFAGLLAAGTYFLFFIKHSVEAVSGWRNEQRRAERLICALYAEIDANVKDLEEYLDRSPSLARVKQAVVSDPDFQPHFTGTVHTLVYVTHLSELASLPRAVIFKVVAFYTQMERISTILDSIDRASFRTISSAGRAQVIEELWHGMASGVRLGKEVLHGLEISAPLDLVNGALEPHRRLPLAEAA